MKLNSKDSFKEESNKRLFEIYSEKTRINIDPQIYAGNLLFERKYNIDSLKEAKKELIKSIEDGFKRKYDLEPKKIIKENITRELILRSPLAIVIFVLFYNSDQMTFHLFSLTINNKIIAIILGLTSYLPLFWLKKSNNKAIKKVEMEIEKKNNLIQKINTELRF